MRMVSTLDVAPPVDPTATNSCCHPQGGARGTRSSIQATIEVRDTERKEASASSPRGSPTGGRRAPQDSEGPAPRRVRGHREGGLQPGRWPWPFHVFICNVYECPLQRKFSSSRSARSFLNLKNPSESPCVQKPCPEPAGGWTRCRALAVAEGADPSVRSACDLQAALCGGGPPPGR